MPCEFPRQQESVQGVDQNVEMVSAANHEVVMDLYLADRAFCIDTGQDCQRLHVPEVDFHVQTPADNDVQHLNHLALYDWHLGLSQTGDRVFVAELLVIDVVGHEGYNIDAFHVDDQ